MKRLDTFAFILLILLVGSTLFASYLKLAYDKVYVTQTYTVNDQTITIPDVRIPIVREGPVLLNGCEVITDHLYRRNGELIVVWQTCPSGGDYLVAYDPEF